MPPIFSLELLEMLGLGAALGFLGGLFGIGGGIGFCWRLWINIPLRRPVLYPL